MTMKVWRKQSTKYVDVNGKRTTKDDPIAKRVRIPTKRFYGTLTLANGKRKQQPLTEDKTSSVTLLRRLQTQEDNKRASGVTEDVERRQKPITGFVDGYGEYLTSKGGTPMHITNTLYRIRSLLTATKTNTIDDLNGLSSGEGLVWSVRDGEIITRDDGTSPSKVEKTIRDVW